MATCKNCGRPLILNGGKCSYCGASPNGQVPTPVSNTEPTSIKLPPVRTFTINGVSFNMILVEGGTFWMGEQNVDPRRPNYDPEANGDSVRRVTVDTFYIGETVVTKELRSALFSGEKYCKEGKVPYYLDVDTRCDNLRVIEEIKCLASEFLARTGEFFKIPTMEEWEFAARGGNRSKGYRFSGGNILNDVGLYWGENFDNRYIGNVMQKTPNELGIYDMSGLVYELCISPSRVAIKGGCWKSISPSECRIASYLDGSFIYDCFYFQDKDYLNNLAGRYSRTGRDRFIGLGLRLALIPKYERIDQ